MYILSRCIFHLYVVDLSSVAPVVDSERLLYYYGIVSTYKYKKRAQSNSIQDTHLANDGSKLGVCMSWFLAFSLAITLPPH